ncbi:MAG: universal stress protein, partial [Nitrospirales bacterium]|nr:universal stress protein [Nitrospirales bacterium]
LGDMRCEAHREIVTTSEVIIKEGVPHEIILAEASAWSADLIVMGARGLSYMQGVILGSVSESVVKSSPCPVMIIH